ncbi:30S ribosomal protein S19 [Candidatus Pacearchaeota archaeon]|nr:MAG: 30S ribosomal protein S19 [Candidatus Pacearchaeota archaeon]
MTEELRKRSKEKFFRGIQIDELKELDLREFAKLVKSRARRFIIRNFDVIEKFVRKCDKREKENKPIKTHNRDIVIVPKLLGKTIGVHNGKEFVKVTIVDEMLGHRLGEFAPTRKPVKHGSAGVGATKSSASRAVK